MSKFIGDLLLEPMDDGIHWKVFQQYEYQSDLLDTTVKIPKDFITDGASIPRIFWNILHPTGPYFRAAIIHDYLYRWQVFTRKQSDDTLLEGMKALNCKYWEYFLIYINVRCFGWWAWKRDKKNPLTFQDLKVNRPLHFYE